MFCIKGIVLPRSRYEPISFSWNVLSGLCCRCSSIPFLPGLGLRTTTASTKRWLKAFWRAPAEQTFSWGHSGGEEFPIFLAGLFGGPVRLILDPWSSSIRIFFAHFQAREFWGEQKQWYDEGWRTVLVDLRTKVWTKIPETTYFLLTFPAWCANPSVPKLPCYFGGYLELFWGQASCVLGSLLV